MYSYPLDTSNFSLFFHTFYFTLSVFTEYMLVCNPPNFLGGLFF